MQRTKRSRRSLLALGGGAASAILLSGQTQAAKPSQANRPKPVPRGEANMQEQIGEAIKQHGVFDAHEHLLGRRQRAQRNPDLFDWIAEAYLWGDLLAAGMDTAILSDKAAAPAKKWAALEKFLPLVDHTGYMKVCRYAWRDLCGMDGPYL